MEPANLAHRKETGLLREFVDDRRFAFAELILVLLCGVIGIIKPELAFWCLPIALLPWLFRSLAGKFPFQRTWFDLPIFFFFITAVVAYFVAYDRVAAAQKFFFILISILLYYTLISQPEKNHVLIGTLFFAIGFCISLYYFLTYNFIASAGNIEARNEIGTWLMQVQKELSWSPIPSGYVPGLVVLTTLFAFHSHANANNLPGRVLKLCYFAGFGIVVFAILMTASMSVWVATAASVGVWLVWRFFKQSKLDQAKRNLFPWVIMVYLMFVFALLYIVGPATTSTPNYFGSNSRREIFGRSAYFLSDFPITGGGLASFPGLYSHYILGIPYFYFSNSYNLFLDVAIEQGLFGGFAIALLYLAGIIETTQTIQYQETDIKSWLALFVLIFVVVHGMMQDYLYNMAGTILLLFPIGMSKMVTRTKPQNESQSRKDKSGSFINRRNLVSLTVGIFLLVAISMKWDKLGSIWYSNLGAVQLARVELTGFPKSGWPGLKIVPSLSDADTSLHASLQLDPKNLTANYLLGLIYMLRRDYVEASKYLEIAYSLAPYHRGVIKSLGYSYLWLDESDKAHALLAGFPEASGELEAYYWWWKNQGRADLAQKAYTMFQKLNTTTLQP